MKLRIFYLEERIQKISRARAKQELQNAKHADGDGGATGRDIQELEEELFQAQLLAEEKTRELEERNVLLVKARNAIETLQTDLQASRSELDSFRRAAGEQVRDLRNARRGEWLVFLAWGVSF